MKYAMDGNTCLSAHTRALRSSDSQRGVTGQQCTGFHHYTGMIPYSLIESGKANNVPELRAKYYRLK